MTCRRWSTKSSIFSGCRVSRKLVAIQPLLLSIGRRVGADPLLKDSNFCRFWLGGALNNGATQISGLALPLCAALLLNATSFQMGILVAVQFMPFALFGLSAGVWLDRHRKRPALLGCKLMSLLALLSVPLAYQLGFLSIPWLYAVSFVLGFSFLVGGSAEQILLTAIVGRDGLLAAQARFSGTDSVARLLGPGVAGSLVQVLSAPFALLATAFGMALSIAVTRTIQFPDAQPASSAQNRYRDMCEGIQFIWRDPMLFALAWGVGLWNVLFVGYAALNVVFATRTLGLSPGALGFAEAAGGAGILAGALAAGWLARRYGTGAAILAGLGTATAAFFLMAVLPARPGHETWTVTLAYAVILMLRDAGMMLIALPYMTLRQTSTPDEFMGRVVTTMRFLTGALTPLGALGAGFVADQVGLRTALFSIGFGSLVITLLLQNRIAHIGKPSATSVPT